MEQNDVNRGVTERQKEAKRTKPDKRFLAECKLDTFLFVTK